MFAKIITFTFRFQTPALRAPTTLPEAMLQSSQNLVKSNQDHVNEIMASNKNPSELSFAPITSFWKKKLRVPKNQHLRISSLAQQQQKPKPQHAYFPLFQNEDIQKELVVIFLSYTQHSELQLKRSLSVQSATTSDNAQAFTVQFDQQPGTQPQPNKLFEQQKYILMTRINVNLMLVILSFQSREVSLALKNLLYDINNDTEPLNESLKRYLISIRGVSLVLWRLAESRHDATVLVNAIDLLLNLSSQGLHYTQYIEELAEARNIQVLFTVFEHCAAQLQIIEKLSVILQRVSYLSQDFRNRVTPRQLRLLEQKMLDLQSENSDDFLSQNLQAILDNVR